MASGAGPQNQSDLPPVMKRSHHIRSQRERWSADLPFPASMPTARPDDALPQPHPPKKRVCLAPSNSTHLPSSENSFLQASRQNSTRRVPRPSSTARAPNHNPSSAPPKDHATARQLNIRDILAQLEESYQNRGGSTMSQDRAGARIHEIAPNISNRKEAPKPDTKIRQLGRHFWSSSKGPRAEEPTRMGPYLHIGGPSTMESKCKSTNQLDYHAYRQATKPAKIFTYCEKCKGVVPNCPLCGLLAMLGRPAVKRPSPEEMIRENAQYYSKLFKFNEQSKVPPKPPKKRREPVQPTASRLSLYPDGKRPDWDTLPEKGPEYSTWDTNDTPTQTSLWDQPIAMPPEPIPDAHQAKKPLLAAQRPRDKISEPFLRQRPESNTGKVVCFRCWNYGHISKNCPESYATDVEEQEIRRVLKPFPLVPGWETILRSNELDPMTVEEALRIQTLREPKMLPNSQTFGGEQELITNGTAQPPAPLKTHAQADIPNCKNAVALVVTATSQVENELTNTSLDFSSGSESFNIIEVENISESPTPSSSSDIPSNSFFKPDNARYKPVGKGPREQNMIKLSPIGKIPNEIISTIIRMVLEDEDVVTGKSISTVYDEESSLQNRNLQLDSIRKINTLWRSLCQAELYRSVPMTSLRTLRRFAECVAHYPELSGFVREIKIYIPFTSVDGWTPSGIPRGNDERYTTSTSAKCLSLIIAACPNLSRLDASFAGVLQSLSYLTKAHNAITHLSLDDWLPRKNDLRNLGKSVNRFPNLQLLQLETSHEPSAEWKKISTGPKDFLTRGTLLTSITFKDFPIHDEFLERALPNFPLLRTLQIERCSGVSQKGLAKALMGLEDPRLTTLAFIGSKAKATECHIDGDPHLCEAIASKLGSCLINLKLSSIPVCENLGSSVSNWSQLEKLVIEGAEFQGCRLDTTEADVQEAMAVSGIFNLRIDSFVFFGER
ncbi:hypothetical protein AOL_s00097g619 [Orbilia oligospora ATCC 24927]|uniref:CCHC-type domain-containing protein n=1 Tax=Arthrobotrys oligospora (strain ATCC 24927 / CBS 115.81 / DSM 1491) TaxID=756982 RepID=G1XJS9_ARTOA|nr:hypothetical protein AOL_s00097g619 [Orbilia oligospora ATCC 24927]EGX46603.1 hypothetical protein AOL_s00097g619 [Orbilia oligospora ATCC 24927]